MRTVVAIDGPAGAGKSTVARALAARLGATYIDTGAMYRAIALAAVTEGLAPEDGAELSALLGVTHIDLDGSRVILNGTDVSTRIRAADVTGAVSSFAALPAVRERLVELQRSVARRGSVVMEGRDIGTAVLPDADFKFFLTADLRERARRRFEESPGADLDEVIESVAARDAADEGRTLSPLIPAADAVVVDTTGRSVAEVVDELASLMSDGTRS